MIYYRQIFWGVLALSLAACTVNPATGGRQFTGLMSSSKEAETGAGDYKQIVATYGNRYDGSALQAYVGEVGARVAANAERKDVTYRFYVLDSQAVNAMALPGGYIFVTRGLLALANSEDELAGVLAHEVGHVAARHSAERYSQGVLAAAGSAAVAVAFGSVDASQAFGLGSTLLSYQYSRDQEIQADDLGVRYLAKAGYDPLAMARFLADMQAWQTMAGGLAGGSDFFSNHPQTAGRVAHATAEAASLPKPAARPDPYLDRIDGLLYGDGPEQGMVRGQVFYHPALDVTFTAPEGFAVVNSPDKVIASGPEGSLMLFDGAANTAHLDPAAYIAQVWLNGETGHRVDALRVSGHEAATTSFDTVVRGKPMKIRLVVVQWMKERFFRFQIAMPKDASVALVEELQRSTFSLRGLSDAERRTVKAYRVAVVNAVAGDAVENLARSMAVGDVRLFRVLNGMGDGDRVVVGKRYKVVE